MKKDTYLATVVECLPNLQFKVEFEDGRIMRCVQAGKMRLNKVKLYMGDKVEVYHTREMGDIGRIVWRRQ